MQLKNIKDYFVYDESSPSCLKWKVKVGGKCRTNLYCGTMCENGYWITRFNNKIIACHRIIWELINGPIPEKMEIDHINRNKFDNKISNLRLATRSQNSVNQKIRKTNKTGSKGVDLRKDTGLYRARITVNYKEISLGNFETIEEAEFAYEQASIKYFGVFSNL